eukprot:1143056-Pelagomonas_calceolata.AAC.3
MPGCLQGNLRHIREAKRGGQEDLLEGGLSSRGCHLQGEAVEQSNGIDSDTLTSTMRRLMSTLAHASLHMHKNGNVKKPTNSAHASTHTRKRTRALICACARTCSSSEQPCLYRCSAWPWQLTYSQPSSAAQQRQPSVCSVYSPVWSLQLHSTTYALPM